MGRAALSGTANVRGMRLSPSKEERGAGCGCAAAARHGHGSRQASNFWPPGDGRGMRRQQPEKAHRCLRTRRARRLSAAPSLCCDSVASSCVACFILLHAKSVSGSTAAAAAGGRGCYTLARWGRASSGRLPVDDGGGRANADDGDGGEARKRGDERLERLLAVCARDIPTRHAGLLNQ